MRPTPLPIRYRAVSEKIARGFTKRNGSVSKILSDLNHQIGLSAGHVAADRALEPGALGIAGLLEARPREREYRAKPRHCWTDAAMACCALTSRRSALLGVPLPSAVPTVTGSNRLLRPRLRRDGSAGRRSASRRRRPRPGLAKTADARCASLRSTRSPRLRRRRTARRPLRTAPSQPSPPQRSPPQRHRCRRPRVLPRRAPAARAPARTPDQTAQTSPSSAL